VELCALHPTFSTTHKKAVTQEEKKTLKYKKRATTTIQLNASRGPTKLFTNHLRCFADRGSAFCFENKVSVRVLKDAKGTHLTCNCRAARNALAICRRRSSARTITSPSEGVVTADPPPLDDQSALLFDGDGKFAECVRTSSDWLTRLFATGEFFIVIFGTVTDRGIILLLGTYLDRYASGGGDLETKLLSLSSAHRSF
jgi:hypothetical protein